MCIVDALPRVWGTGDQGLLGESMCPRLAEYILSFTMGLDSSEVKRFFFVVVVVFCLLFYFCGQLLSNVILC